MIAPLRKQIGVSVALKARSLLARLSSSSSVGPMGKVPSSSGESDTGARCRPQKPAMATSSFVSIRKQEPLGLEGPANGNGNGDRLEREYLEAVRELNGLQSNNRVLSLAKYNDPKEILPHVRKQLQFAGIEVNDLNRLNALHITGTKGKGSTCIFVESILLSSAIKSESHGERRLKVGCYTSPHLIQVTERIRLNGRPIDKATFVENFWHVFDKLKAGSEREQLVMPSYFTFLTILAFYTFLKEQVDCAIIEVGIGGEFDPTNVLVKPVACAITTLDLDHTNILGRTLKSIAWTKAGIVKLGVPMFTVEHDQVEATEMIKFRATQSNSPVYVSKPIRISDDRQLGIKGKAQTINASVACELASCLLNHLEKHEQRLIGTQSAGIPIGFTGQEVEYEALPESFRQGLTRAALPGRCQIVEFDKLCFFIDGAHTRKSVENCLKWFNETSSRLGGASHHPFRYLMINIIGERDRQEVLKPILLHSQLFRKLIFTSNRIDILQVQEKPASDNYSHSQSPFHERSLENVLNNAKVWSDLAKDQPTAPKAEVHATISESMQVILHDFAHLTSTKTFGDLKNFKPHILATGSLHFVGAVLEAIERLGDD